MANCWRQWAFSDTLLIINYVCLYNIPVPLCARSSHTYGIARLDLLLHIAAFMCFSGASIGLESCGEILSSTWVTVGSSRSLKAGRPLFPRMLGIATIYILHIPQPILQCTQSNWLYVVCFCILIGSDHTVHFWIMQFWLWSDRIIAEWNFPLEEVAMQ